MVYYLTAYIIFWIVLLGYMLILSRRQQRLNTRAERLVERLKARGGEVRDEPEAGTA
jgi:CcmD family protein